jgi:hypothetical protein
MSSRKGQLKKMFLIATTTIVALTFVVYLIVIFNAFQFQQEMSDRKVGDEILRIHDGVPRGWAYAIHTEESKIEPLGALGKATAQVDFTLPDLNAELGGEARKLSLYFFPQSRRTEVLAELERTAAPMSSADCRPLLYHETHDYVILNNSCDRLATEKADEYAAKLKSELLEFWFRFQ